MTREQAVAEALGVDPATLSLRPVGGGCINDAAVAEVDGARVFVKWNDRPLPDQFAAEAAALRALAEAGSSLRIPRVLGHGDGGPGRSFLAIEFLDSGARGADFDERLGRGLAELHRGASGARFGFDIDGYCGATPQPNGWMDRWVDFYRERRLGHQLRLARERGLSGDHVATLDRLIDRIDEWIDDDEPPALIHGDLWSGNLHVAEDGPALIDPAAYVGHREAELGMMVLFGGFSSRVFDAYHETWPLREGYEERLPLYSLYHVLNHYNLFGGGYGAQAVSIARRFV